jgi:hypothetical protein
MLVRCQLVADGGEPKAFGDGVVGSPDPRAGYFGEPGTVLLLFNSMFPCLGEKRIGESCVLLMF